MIKILFQDLREKHQTHLFWGWVGGRLGRSEPCQTPEETITSMWSKILRETSITSWENLKFLLLVDMSQSLEKPRPRLIMLQWIVNSSILVISLLVGYVFEQRGKERYECRGIIALKQRGKMAREEILRRKLIQKLAYFYGVLLCNLDDLRFGSLLPGRWPHSTWPSLFTWGRWCVRHIFVPVQFHTNTFSHFHTFTITDISGSTLTVSLTVKYPFFYVSP